MLRGKHSLTASSVAVTLSCLVCRQDVARRGKVSTNEVQDIITELAKCAAPYYADCLFNSGHQSRSA